MCHSPLQHSYNLYPLNMCVYMFFYICIYTPTHPHPHTPPKLAANCWELLYIKRDLTLILFHSRTACIFYILPFWFWGFWKKIRENCLGSSWILQESDLNEVNEGNSCPINLPRIRKDGQELPFCALDLFATAKGIWGVMTFFLQRLRTCFSGFEINSIESFSQLFTRHPQGLPLGVQWVSSAESRWWQLKHFLFSPRNLGKWSNLTIFFQMGWFNHQLVNVWNSSRSLILLVQSHGF